MGSAMAKLNTSNVTEITPSGEIHGGDPSLQDGKEDEMSGGRVAARHTTNQVRDYMWGEKDKTSTWGPGWKTNREVYEDVTSQRQAGTSTQAIRRSLNWLADQGLLVKDSAQHPEIFRWTPGRAFPGPLPVQSVTPAPPDRTPESRRA